MVPCSMTAAINFVCVYQQQKACNDRLSCQTLYNPCKVYYLNFLFIAQDTLNTRICSECSKEVFYGLGHNFV